MGRAGQQQRLGSSVFSFVQTYSGDIRVTPIARTVSKAGAEAQLHQRRLCFRLYIVPGTDQILSESAERQCAAQQQATQVTAFIGGRNPTDLDDWSRSMVTPKFASANKWSLRLSISLCILCVIPLVFTFWQIAYHEPDSPTLVHFRGYVRTLFKISLSSITFFSAFVGLDIKSIPLKYTISLAAFATVAVVSFMVLRKRFHMTSDRAAWLAVTIGAFAAEVMGTAALLFIFTTFKI